MGLFSKEFGTMITIFNPIYPLQFERFGDGNPDDDPEFKSHLSNLNQGHGVAGELDVDERFYSSVAIYKAEKKARMAYVSENPIAEAKAALKISPNCPEAYNVLAQFKAKTYDEALGKFHAVGSEKCAKYLKSVGESRRIFFMRSLLCELKGCFNIKLLISSKFSAQDILHAYVIRYTPQC